MTSNPNYQKNGTTFSGYYSLDNGHSWKLVATFFANKQLHYLEGLYGFLENFGGDQSQVREGYWGNFTIKNTQGKKAKITQMYFDHTTPKTSADIWMQKQNLGPHHEIYQRIDGPKNQGIFPPTNPQ